MMNQLLVKKQQSVDKITSPVSHSIQNINCLRKPVRTKLWQFDHIYHCAMIGTCLTMEEVTKLLKQLGYNCNGYSNYKLHCTIVTLISIPDFKSKKIQSFLDKKFKTAIQNTKKWNAGELKTEWKKALASGEIIGLFWAAMSHPSTDAEMKKDFYGDMHMLSHLSGFSNRADLKRLNQLEKERKDFNIQSNTLQSKYNKIKEENSRLKTTAEQRNAKVTDLIAQVSLLKISNEKLNSSKNEKQCQQLMTHIEKLNNKIVFQENELSKHQKQVSQLRELVSQAEKQMSINDAFLSDQQKEKALLQIELNQQKNQDCPLGKEGLCGQCVLYVGGKANLIAHYRELVETKSGVFLHHDGGNEKSTKDLPQFLKRADWVIFPSDCISHDAYWQIKQICKKQKTSYKYLNSPGLHSLGTVLDKIIANTEMSEA
jgi:hypothetical protein